MSGFDSDAAAYIVGILVGAAVAIAILGFVGWYCYRRLGINNLEEDEELQALRRQASMFEEPNQAERDDPVMRPTSSGAALTESVEPNRTRLRQSTNPKPVDNRKHAWKF